MRRLLSLLVVLATMAPVGAEVKLTIPNQLNHTWPGELVSFELGKGKVPAGDLALEVQGMTRPAQREGDRVWSYVTIRDRDAEGEKIEISTVPAVLKKAKVEPGIRLKQEGEYYLIDNGTYQFRLRKYTGKLAKPMKLGDLPHWCGGMRAKGQKVSHIHLRHLNPFPANLNELLAGFAKVLVPEMNTGQLLRQLRAEGNAHAQGLNKVSGQPFLVREIEQAISNVMGED